MILVVVGGLAGTLLFIYLLTWLVIDRNPWHLLGGGLGNAELDVVKVALTMTAGAGGAVALVVAYRRQQHLETDEAGAREREKAFRDRYASAAQQLGDPQAAVRLAGVYAMANLVDGWADQRQQCVDVLCAYLRLPWVNDADGQAEPISSTSEQTWLGENERQHKETRTYAGRAGEREVRRTLLRVLADHVRRDASPSWSDLELNFRRARLPTAYFVDAVFTRAPDFTDVTFDGRATFGGAAFTGPAHFDRATFCDDADFTGATINFEANFHGASFGSAACFHGVTISSSADFVEAKFTHDADFSHATFNRSATFAGVRHADSVFERVADFTNATFGGVATFRHVTDFALRANFLGRDSDPDEAAAAAATFAAGASFRGATFHADAQFGEDVTTATRFQGMAEFSGATFAGEADFRDVHFEHAKFGADGSLTGAIFRKRADFSNASFSWANFGADRGAAGCQFTGFADFDGAFFSRVARFRGARIADGSSEGARFRSPSLLGGGLKPFDIQAHIARDNSENHG